ITPIDNSADLYREGASMHHCVGTYAEEVKAGRYYVYSICRDGERVATSLTAVGRDYIKSEVHATPRRRNKSARRWHVGYERKHPDEAARLRRSGTWRRWRPPSRADCSSSCVAKGPE